MKPTKPKKNQFVLTCSIHVWSERLEKHQISVNLSNVYFLKRHISDDLPIVYHLNAKHEMMKYRFRFRFSNVSKEPNLTSTTCPSPPTVKASYHVRRQKRRKLSAYRNLKTYKGTNKTGDLTKKKSALHRSKPRTTKSSKLTSTSSRQSIDNGVVDLTLTGSDRTIKNAETYKIRFMHNREGVGNSVGRLKPCTDDENDSGVDNINQNVSDKERTLMHFRN